MTKVPEMIEDISIFCEILKAHAAKGEVFQMDPLTPSTLIMISSVDLLCKFHNCVLQCRLCALV